MCLKLWHHSHRRVQFQSQSLQYITGLLLMSGALSPRLLNVEKHFVMYSMHYSIRLGIGLTLYRTCLLGIGFISWMTGLGFRFFKGI